MPTRFASANAEEVDFGQHGLTRQAIFFFLHCAIAVAAWFAMMLVGYAINPTFVPQLIVLAFSAVIPLIVGYIVARIRPNEMAMHIWLAGIIWILCMSLWILDMPTGPNACLNCTAAEKLTRTFFSFPSPSGLFDDNGPFFATWPAAALIGYAIGARFAISRTTKHEE